MLNICVYCWQYQKRLNWQLHSLSQQTSKDFLYHLSVCDDDPYVEETHKLLKKYNGKLNLNVKWYCFNNFLSRGITRNNNIKEINEGWILYTDGDYYYSQGFIEKLNEFIEKQTVTEKILFGCGHYSTTIEYGNQLAEISDIQGEYFKGIELKYWRKIGAGNFQLFNKNSNPLATYPEWDKQIRNNMDCKSDKGFRKQFDKGIRVDVGEEKLFHINHYRVRKGEDNLIKGAL